MLTYTRESFTADRQKLVDSMGGVGSIYINWKHLGGQECKYRVGIAPTWNTSKSTKESTLLFLQLDGTLVSGHPYSHTDQHNVFASGQEAKEALTKFIAAGCPGLILENLSAKKAATKAANSSVKANKAEGILRGMELADLIALRAVVDAAIAKKTPKK